MNTYSSGGRCSQVILSKPFRYDYSQNLSVNTKDHVTSVVMHSLKISLLFGVNNRQTVFVSCVYVIDICILNILIYKIPSSKVATITTYQLLITKRHQSRVYVTVSKILFAKYSTEYTPIPKINCYKQTEHSWRCRPMLNGVVSTRIRRWRHFH